MALLSEQAEIEEVAPRTYRQTIHVRPIAVRENGSLVAINSTFTDSGEGATPHIVNRAPLRSRVANDGMRRLYPIPGDDSSYIEIGAPYVKVGGVWTQVSLGAPTRSANLITWTRQQTITRIFHGGHFVKLDIELLNGFVPEDSQLAFPVGLSGLTRSGTVLSKNGTPVMRLNRLIVEDADNLDDIRPITHQFVNLSGQPYLLLTLPALTGMARPRIDPTLSVQPDASAGIDTAIRSTQATNNHGVTSSMTVGELNTATNDILRALIKFDLSSIPSAAKIDASTLSLYATGDAATNARVGRVYRVKRAWTEGSGNGTATGDGATWNTYNGSNNWSTAGGFHADDCEQTDIGYRPFLAAETLNEFKDIHLTPLTKSGLDLGNGWLIKMDTEVNDAYTFASSDHATAANRPKLSIEYSEPVEPMLHNLVAHYSLGSAVAQHGGLNLTNDGGSFVTGKVANAVELVRADTDNLTHPNHARFNFGDIDFTITCWVKMASKTGIMGFVSKFESTNDQRSYVIGYNNTPDRFHVMLSPLGTTASNVTVNANNFGSPSTNVWYFLAVRYNAATDTVSISVNDGTPDTGSVSGGAYLGTAEFQMGSQDTGNYADAVIDEASIWKRYLADSEIAFLYNNGNGRTYGEITSIKLYANQGAYALNGQTTNLRAARKLITALGSHTLAGQVASLEFGRRLAANQGAYAYAGQASLLKRGYPMVAVGGVYVLSGQAATLRVARRLSVAQGSYVLSGQSLNLFYGRTLIAVQGSYVLTGNDVALVYTPVGHYELVTESGVYVLAGQNANLLYGRIMTASQGAYVLSGQDVRLIFGHLLSAAQGGYVLTGEAIAFLINRQLATEFGSYILSGQPVTFDWSGFVQPPTPDERTFVVVVEDRVYSIPVEDRVFRAEIGG